MMAALETRLSGLVRPLFAVAPVRWIGLLGLCAAYIQGPVSKLTDFPAAIAEMQHFGLSPAAPFAVVVIVFELAASAMILTGFFRWLAALGLAGFTLIATFLALRFWELPAGQERFMAANSFFEHLGLVGGFLLVAWLDLNSRFVLKTKV
ncbi:putative membrane protein [Rhizobium sp. CF142]|nr:putative membrane protein [Rhizobium sp. CF142]